MIEQNKLPNKYLVKTNKDHPLWNKFADYINKLEKVKLAFNLYYYGQYDDEAVAYCDIYPDYKLLTLEEWDSIVNPKFILPEKWCYKPKNETEGIIIREWFNTYREYRRGSEDEFYWHYPAYEKESNRSSHYCNTFKKPSYTEITFDQFKEHVLNKTNNNMNNNTEDQEIIGYKLVREKYKKQALEISNTSSNWENSQQIYDISVKQTGYISKLQDAGVLDLWFTPVYKPKYELPEINGYKGMIFDNQIQYGCTFFDKNYAGNVIREVELFNSKVKDKISGNNLIKSIILENGVVINSDQLKQIVDYINNK